MKLVYNKIITPAVFFLFLSTQINAQVAKDYAVLLSVTYNEAIPEITISWNSDASATEYKIYRKLKEETGWDLLETYDGTATEYNDTDIEVASGYEYKVKRTTSSGITAEGYLFGGIKLPAIDYRGSCLLIIDTTISETFETDLQQLMKDISGDGWSIKRINVARNNSVDSIKNLIISYSESDTELASIVLFGHVPVPYSGDLFPDGHPDHEGAWPFDGYYADLDGEYTDETVNVTVATREENKNIPGDGKFDQSYFDSKAELQVGRIDLYNLPSFSSPEEILLKNYLKKDHAFRTGNIKPEMKSLIDDNFGAFYGEAFASNGWRNFSPMFSDAEIFELDYFTTLREETYLWSYGCGGGWYQGSSGIGSTTDFAADSVKGIFTMLFGSYFGDWDVTDNFLRAPLAAEGYTLTSAWAGRPWWHFHHMVLGENIGYSTRLTQNNSSTYDASYCAKCIHIALMGDPTLRLTYPIPVSDLTLENETGTGNVILNWSASAEEIEGYYVYRCNSEFGKYERITPSIITINTFIDASPINGMNYYMVKAVKLEETPSGSYYNLSTAYSDSIIALPVAVTDIKEQIKIYPNPVQTDLYIEYTNTNSEKVEIFDITGKLIFTQPFTLGAPINVARLVSGIYYLKMNGSITRFIKE